MYDLKKYFGKHFKENISRNLEKLNYKMKIRKKFQQDLIKLMERILKQLDNSGEEEEEPELLAVIPVILNTYINEVPKTHEKLLESIPQQSVLFFNNCMFLAHWIAKNADACIPTHPALVKTLQATGTNIFKAQIVYQQKILARILREFG